MKNIETTCPDPNRRAGHILSGNGVKIIGIILMTMDHLYQMFVNQGAPQWLNRFGRPVAAMFLFLCAEGFFYTRSKKRYMLKLLAGFLFMSAMNRFLSAAMPMEHIVLLNNIFSTLFLAAFYMWMIDRIHAGFREKSPVKILSAAGGMFLPLVIGILMLLAVQSENRTAAVVLLFIPSLFSAEGGFALVFMGVAFYILRKYRLAQAAVVLAVSAFIWYSSKDSAGAGDFQWLMAFAVIPMLLYNGKRGRGGKYFFYIFYPAHIYLLYCAAWFLNGRI
ncbi:MAG: conjugal transfer protein TraX [Spirochaetaceae bacterium]|jgi:hypothetical protein|nr:conjugal transfer protein TraX [Spirochaetaceae bacterium]